MNAEPIRRPSADDTPAAVRAALQLWTEIERARNERDAAAALVSRLAATLELLLDGLPAAARQEYQRRLDEIRGSGVPADNRGGEIYSNVIELFRRSGPREWSMAEIQDALGEKEKPVDPKTVKAIYNTINYFVKTGRIERVARGRFFVRELGASVDVVDDVVDHGTTRTTEHDYP
jgi:hypothetical protein